MSGPVNTHTEAEALVFKEAVSPLVKRCRCGRNWNVVMERGQSGHHGCIRCSCDAELVSWCGTVMFNAVPTDSD